MGQRKGTRDKCDKTLIELLLDGADSLSSSDQQKWEKLAEKVDSAEFTALLYEEWEKLSSEPQKKKATAEEQAAQKRKWVDSQKKRANGGRAGSLPSRKERDINIRVEAIVESIRKNKFKQSEAFKDMARVACISAEPSKRLFVATDNKKPAVF